MHTHIVIVLALTLLMAACSSSPAAPAPAPAAASKPAPGAAQALTINMTDANQFQPTTLTAPRGTTVTWTNVGAVTHTVTGDPSKAANKSNATLPQGAPPWDSGNVSGGQAYSYTFDTAGTYKYFCTPHEVLGMVGTITVTS
jgi:plastocyanin